VDNGFGSGIPDGVIDSKDSDFLKIRMGYMRYYGCGSNDTVNSTSYNSGCNTLIDPFNTPYSTIYCKSTSCTPASSGTATSVAKEDSSGGTPLAAALQEAKYYLDYSKANDATYRDCRQKFVILITDGDDTYACNNNGQEGQTIQYKGRRETVAQARALANAGYYVFVVGFGSNMPTYLQNTLNWAAYYGKTKNTDLPQSWTQKYTIPDGQIYPTGVTQCMNSHTANGGSFGSYGTYTYATNPANTDPGECGISGYAFIAQNADQLNNAIMRIRNFIITLSAESTSYVAPVVPISQFQSASSENLMYLGMFKPTTTTMWKGNIKKYGIATTATSNISVGDVIDASGALAMDSSTHTIRTTARSYWSASADGGEVEAGGIGGLLQARDPDSRQIYTYSGINTHLTHASNAVTKANTTYITTTLLNVPTSTERNDVIDFVHGWDVWSWNSGPGTKRDWILGAFIHSRPVVIHYASYDVIYAGANDGMLHAFKDSKGTTGDDGTELWGFIPPDLLPKLKTFGDPLASLKIFVDGSPKYYHTDDGKIILIFGERRGGNQYYALDVTDPVDPQFLWSISPSKITTGTTITNSTDYQELGQTWSTPRIGKIKNGTGTKAVAFIGGGYDNTQPTSAEDATPAGTDTSGRAVYIVDIANGNRIWSYTNMTYCVPGDITAIDSLGALGGDGLIDRLYLGNVGGEIWRFDLCSSTVDPTHPCVPDMNNTGNWTGKRIFTGSGKIFYPPDVSFENSRQGMCSTMAFSGTYNMLFFGTGDRERPNDTGSGNRLYAVKDYDILPNPFTTIPESCLTDVTSYGTTLLSTLQSSMGWYIRLNQSPGTNQNPGEKCTGQAVALAGAVYYTTFTPTPAATGCAIGTGSGNIYILQYQTGNAYFDQNGDGVLDATDWSIPVVAGLPSGVIVAIITDSTGGSTVTNYGGVPDGVISPPSGVTNAIIPIDWRIMF
jgi:type IV pilus assembly protein PilY1